MTITQAQRNRIFGHPGKVDKVTVTTPWGIKTACHRVVAGVFLAACRDAHENSPWRPRRIDSYNPRPIRGTEDDPKPKWSLHAYALAWDFFATPPNVPPPGGVWTPDNPVPPYFASCFTRRGFRWGSEFDRVDFPHIEWAAGLPDETATEAHPLPGNHQEDDLTPEQDRMLRDVHAALEELFRPTYAAVKEDGPIDRQLKEIRRNTRQ